MKNEIIIASAILSLGMIVSTSIYTHNRPQRYTFKVEKEYDHEFGTKITQKLFDTATGLSYSRTITVDFPNGNATENVTATDEFTVFDHKTDKRVSGFARDIFQTKNKKLIGIDRSILQTKENYYDDE